MTKELSIENIKKELIDKISSNEEVLEWFKNNDNVKWSGMDVRDFVKEYVIFNNSVAALNEYHENFIAIEVGEHELGYKKDAEGEKNIKPYYCVIITIAYEDDNLIDKLSVLIGKIVTESYPDRYNYDNLGCAYIHEKHYTHIQRDFVEKEMQLIRNIHFTIE